MAKLTAFIKRHWLAVVLCCVIVALVISVIVPFIINESYKKGAGYITLWEAKDVLAFYGCFLSFLGSLSLGIVAIFQNKKANDQTAKANKLTEQMQRLEQAKFISMVEVKLNQHIITYQTIGQVKSHTRAAGYFISLAADCPGITKCYILDTTITNKSDFPIVQIGIHPGKRGTNVAELFGMINYQNVVVYIPANGAMRLEIAIPSDLLKAASITSLALSFEFTNIFDYSTAATLYLEDYGVENKSFRAQYRLSKFVDVKPN